MNNSQWSDNPPPYTATNMIGQQQSAVHKLIVGVDFGTTFTGVSWVSSEGAHVKNIDDVHCINDWSVEFLLCSSSCSN